MIAIYKDLITKDRDDYRGCALDALQLVVRALVDDVSGVQSGSRLEQQKPALFFGNRLVLDAARDNDEFALFNPFVGTVEELHAEAPFDHEKQFVLVVVMMKDELEKIKEQVLNVL